MNDLLDYAKTIVEAYETGKIAKGKRNDLAYKRAKNFLAKKIV